MSDEGGGENPSGFFEGPVVGRAYAYAYQMRRT